MRMRTLAPPLLIAGTAWLLVSIVPPEPTGIFSERPPFADFVEPDFPFIITTVDARHLAPAFPRENLAVRGIAIQLGNDAYTCFDPDLLRMSLGWHGAFVEMGTMAQVSYHEAGNKQNTIPRALGRPVFGTGRYPGWTDAALRFDDPRPPGPDPDALGRGPLPVEQGRWNGLYVAGDRVVLSYTVRGTDVQEQPGSVKMGEEVGITRAFRTSEVTARPLTLVLADVGEGTASEVTGRTAAIAQGDVVTAVGVVGAPEGARLWTVEDRYLALSLPDGMPPAQFHLVIWRGPKAQRGRFEQMLEQPVEMADPARGGPGRWTKTVTTSGMIAPATEAFVVDELTLPIPNPWQRNVRPAGVDFFEDGRAALVTFEGDVWIVSGIDEGLGRLKWRRFASGLYESLSLAIVDGAIYTHSRSGIMRLRDLNGDGEADLYENVSDLPIQSGETREYPLDMAPKPGGGFYVSQGAALDNGPKTAPAIARGFRAGSRHSGSVLEVAPDGRSIRTVATGFREPYLGVHPQTGALTASDQQGNAVPSSPIYVVEENGYYGVPATAHREAVPEIKKPLVWMPHEVDPSSAGQLWVTSDRMGPLSGALVHLSYGRPGPFRVYPDSARGEPQGAAIAITETYPAPVLKGAVNPKDGQLYLSGFQIYGSQAEQVGGFTRLRYTGRPSTLPTDVRAGEEGILVRFGIELDSAAATDPASYAVRRWDYRRTEAYGSGHFKPGGEPGQETVPVRAAFRSEDGKAVLLVTAEMHEAMQMAVGYDLQSTSGMDVRDTLYLTVNAVAPLGREDLRGEGFGDVDWTAVREEALASAEEETPEEAALAAPASVEAGEMLYRQIGCIACHSVDGTTAGKLGPSFKGLFGSTRAFADGTERRADAAYIEQSIWEPASQIVAGYDEGMPAYLGILDEADIASLTLFIRSLSDESDEVHY